VHENKESLHRVKNGGQFVLARPRKGSSPSVGRERVCKQLIVKGLQRSIVDTVGTPTNRGKARRYQEGRKKRRGMHQIGKSEEGFMEQETRDGA
jgi:hypothetical protein